MNHRNAIPANGSSQSKSYRFRMVDHIERGPSEVRGNRDPEKHFACDEEHTEEYPRNRSGFGFPQSFYEAESPVGSLVTSQDAHHEAILVFRQVDMT